MVVGHARLAQEIGYLSCLRLGLGGAPNDGCSLCFALTALAWITRAEPFGGWQAWLVCPAANDASVALLAVLALFVARDNQGEPLIEWQQASQIPWGVLLLFGGGICLAALSWPPA